MKEKIVSTYHDISIPNVQFSEIWILFAYFIAIKQAIYPRFDLLGVISVLFETSLYKKRLKSLLDLFVVI